MTTHLLVSAVLVVGPVAGCPRSNQYPAEPALDFRGEHASSSESSAVTSTEAQVCWVQ